MQGHVREGAASAGARRPRALPVGRPSSLLVAVVVVLGVVSTACTSTVTGAGRPAPPGTATPAAGAPSVTGLPPPTLEAPPTAPTDPGTGESTVPAPVDPEPGPDAAHPATRSGLASDVVADECLLDAPALGALTGVTVRPPRQSRVPRSDGSVGSSCVAGSGPGEPVATIDVYLPRSGTPADFVRGGPQAGRRTLTGVGDAAAIVDTAPGTVLQIAGPRHVVTIAVLDGAPSDDAWRNAARLALDALPS